MDSVQFRVTSDGKGLFYVNEGAELIGEMVVGIYGSDMTVFHTEVSPKAQGQGLAKKLLNTMVDYARQHQLKVIALCPYVHAEFARHPDKYGDIWKKQTE